MEVKEIKFDRLGQTCFEIDGKTINCEFAIKRDTKFILQEAEKNHKEMFSVYDPNSLKTHGVRIYVDEKNEPLFGMMTYVVHEVKNDYFRLACGNYYPIEHDMLLPHTYQGSICW